MYECTGCKNRFKTSGWLSRHHKSCKARKALLEAGVRKFGKAHGAPETRRNLLSRLTPRVSGRESSDNLAAGSSSGTHAEKDHSQGPGATFDPDVPMTDSPPPEMTETEFVSHLRSLAAEENEWIEPPEPSAPSVRRATRTRRPTRKVQGDRLAEVSRQELPLAATDAAPPSHGAL